MIRKAQEKRSQEAAEIKERFRRMQGGQSGARKRVDDADDFEDPTSYYDSSGAKSEVEKLVDEKI